MKDYILDKKSIVFFTTIWWAFFTAFSISQYNPFQLLNIIGFLFLILVPGLLTVLVLRLEGLEFWGYTTLSIGFSLLELVVVALLGNFTLPFFGVAQPLDNSILLLEITFLIFSLLALNWWRWVDIKISLRRFAIFDNARDLALALFPVVFVCMSVAGAMRLNNSLSGTVTLAMLIGIVVYLAVLIWYSRRVGPNVIPVALFFVSLSLLLMTSLRGWYITGHDIQREYRVFELAKNTGIWDISVFRDAYNACMSITILPTIFYNTLKFFDPYVYKIFFQIIFATVPGVVYLIAKRYVSEATALLATIYFIAFPTFFTDMPMLNRQEIAFFFLAVMFYFIYQEQINLFTRRVIFVLLGIGMVLSHYSTTYTVVALLIFLIVAYPIVKRIGSYFKQKGFFKESSYLVLQTKNDPKQRITISVVVFLVGATFLWSSVLTDTSSGSLSRVVAETIKVVQSNAYNDSRSGDVASNFFSWQKPDINKLIVDYNQKIVTAAHLRAPKDTYYPATLYDRYKISPIQEDILPLTLLGKKIDEFGVNVTAFNDYIHVIFSKLLQILIVLGFLFLLFKNRFVIRSIDTEFLLLGVGSFIFLVMLVVLPVLSAEYGVLRALQQSLIFLDIFLVVGSLFLVSVFKEKYRIPLVSFIALFFFASSTGIISQLLGGYFAQLHLNNNGMYYDTYYVRGSEIAGINWLDGQIKNNGGEYQSEVQTDKFTATKVRSLSELDILNDIFPSLIRRDSFLFLGYSNTQKKEASLFYKGTVILYVYPLKFLDDNKDLVYSNDAVRIYR